MPDGNNIRRRTFLQTTVAASAGLSAATNASAESVEAPDNKKEVPYGMIGDVKVSRLILGANVMSEWAHSRDLRYVRQLMRRYNTEERLFNVLKTAEAMGINHMLQGSAKLLKDYNTKFDGHMHHIRHLPVNQEDTEQTIKKKADALIQSGVRMSYVYGCSSDLLVRDGRVDIIGKALEIAKTAGIVCGIGGHSLKVVKDCEKEGLRPAYYLKTFHHDQYWSATPKENRKDFCWYAPGSDIADSGVRPEHNEFHDNMWCLEPEETIEVMSKVKVPWIAYKVLAAGAISPTSGFKYALQNGADFMAVGMLDYQIEEDVAILNGLYARGVKRDRPMMG
jgi:hypothetical protein